MDKKQTFGVDQISAEFSLTIYENGRLQEKITGPHDHLTSALAAMFEDKEVINLFFEALVKRIEYLEQNQKIK